MMRHGIARPKRSRRIGRRSRSHGCEAISSAKRHGASRRKSNLPPTARSGWTRRSRAIWRRARALRKPCSIISTPNSRVPIGASAARSRKRSVPEMTLVEAVNVALARALGDDPDVVLLGEDIGVNGGVFRATVGLQQRFGHERVVDTPLAELLISGLCVGMAAQGLKPVGEIQFSGFIYPCIDQLANHASRLRNRTQGRLSCPMVLRTPHGGGIRAPEHHSESTEAMLAHIPGLRVVIPSSPERAYGLLLAAIRDPDPVVFLEPTRIYRAAKGQVEDTGEALP